MENVKKFVENRDKYENLVFFGGGERLSSMILFFEICNLKMPVAICDNDVNKQGTTLYDIPVISFDEACNKFDDIQVLITNERYMEEIFQQVTEKISSKQVRFYFSGELFGNIMPIDIWILNRFIRNRDDFKNLIFFGAGEYMNEVMSLFEMGDIKKPIAICDNDVNKHGTQLYDIPVMSFDDAYNKFGDNMHIVITSRVHTLEILHQISKKISIEKIFFYNINLIEQKKSEYMGKKDERLLDPSYIKEKLKYYQDLYDKGENIKVENDNYFIKSSDEYVNLNDYMDRENVGNTYKLKINDEFFLVSKFNVNPKKMLMEDNYIENSIENIVSFNNYLKDKEIPFAYIQAPHIVSTLTGNDFDNMYDDANRQADKFIRGLNENNINNLDLRDYVMENNIKPEDWFFRTDFHWTPRAAFQANKVICEYINGFIDCELNYDYFDIDNYNVKVYENMFLGAVVKNLGLLYFGGGEDFEMITPKFETDFSWICEEKGVHKRGIAEDVLILHEQLESVYYSAGYMYAAYKLFHANYVIIKNYKKKNYKKKIFIINDSFSMPLSMFITQQFMEVHFFDFRQEDFSKKLFEAIKNVKPDMVLIMYHPPYVLSRINSFDVGYER